MDATPQGRGTARRRTIAAVAALFACGLVGGVGALPAVASGSQHGHHAKGLILSPDSGKGYAAKPVLIRVHTGKRSHDFRARLNGRPIGQHFSQPSRHGVRRLEASLSYGLRHGSNRLRVHEGRHRSQTLRFRIWRGRPLVGAGIDRRVAAGAKVYVTGRVREAAEDGSHPRTALKAGSASGSGFEWSTVSTPPGAPPSAPRDTTKRRTFIATSVPGRYSLKLSAAAPGGKQVSDTVTVTADPAPAVWVDTMTTRGTPHQDWQRGITVGGDFYAEQDGSWAQLVVLDRETLQPVAGNLSDLASKSYTNCSAQDVTPCANALKSDLARLSGDQIAIVASQPGGGGGDYDNVISPKGLEVALARIGVSRTFFSDSSNPNPGTISAIGVPGTPAGEGDWHADNRRQGGMRGYLVRGNKDNYVFTSNDRLRFDTQAKGSTHSVNLVQVGGSTYDQPPQFSGGYGGFQVLIVDAQTLDEIDSSYFATGTCCSSRRPTILGELEDMRDKLHEANTAARPQLVFIVSLKDPEIEYYGDNDNPDSQINGDLAQLVDEVERLGGTRNAIYKTLTNNNPNSSYTLVSLANSGPGQGDEAVAPGPGPFGDGPMNTIPISGTLARTGPNYRFEVQDSPRIGPESSGRDPSLGAAELGRIAFQSPKPWPEQDPSVFPNAGERARKQAAVGWIGKQVLNTNDIRAQYWTSGLNADGEFDEATWKDIAFAIQDLDYPDAENPSFNSADLEWAKTELAGPSKRSPLAGGEIGWLLATHKYLEKLAQPFQSTQLKNWANLQDVATAISTKVNTAPTTPIPRVNVTAIFDFVRNIAEVAPEVGEAAIAVNAVYDLVSELTEVDVGGETVPADDDFSSTASKVGVDLADRLSAAQEMLARQLPNTIAADYGKLSVVGACAKTISPEPAKCPFPMSDWQYSQQDQKNAGGALVNATRVWAYGQLLPAKYTLFRLAQWWRTSVSDNEDFYATCGAGKCLPFKGLPATAQVAKPIYRNMPTFGHTVSVVPVGATTTWGFSGDTWQIFALGHLDKSDDANWRMQFPDKSVTDELFNGAAQGGLGADPETFFDRYFNPVPLTEYPKGYDVGWCVNGHRACGGQDPPCCGALRSANIARRLAGDRRRGSRPSGPEDRRR
jgi:hypothetical protein